VPHLLIDLDGTLLPDNIFPLQRREMLRAIRAHLHPDPDGLLVNWTGKTDVGLFWQYANVASPSSPTTVTLALNAYTLAFLAALPVEIPCRLDAPTVLAALRRDGYTVRCVTGNVRAVGVAKLCAAGLDRYLDLRDVTYGDHCRTREEVIRRAVLAAGERPVGLVGDTHRDVEAAHAFGLTAYALVTPAHPITDLGPADVFLPTLAALPSAIKQQEALHAR